MNKDVGICLLFLNFFTEMVTDLGSIFVFIKYKNNINLVVLIVVVDTFEQILLINAQFLEMFNFRE